MIEIRTLRASTCLLQWDGKTILTDPWFAGHMRGLPVFVRPCLSPEQLPPLDLVLVSHTHSDHFDRRAMTRLRFPCRRLIGPPQIAARAQGLNVEHLRIMRDGDALAVDDWRIHAYRVEHSGYENAYVVTHHGLSLLFAGDARYSDVFVRIGQNHRPQASLLPVGGTQILERRIVMDPADALRAATDLQTSTVVPIHPGGEWLSVPPLSRHPGRTAHLADLAARANAPFTVVATKPGDTVRVDENGRLREETR